MSEKRSWTRRRVLGAAPMAGWALARWSSAAESPAEPAQKEHIVEKLDTPVAGDYDVVVAGAGPAGVPAAVAAAKAGARVLLVEAGGCLGGVWTSGQLAWVFDVEKQGFAHELAERLPPGAYRPHTWYNGMNCFSYDVEAMKLILEQFCQEQKVDVLLHTRVVAAQVDAARRLRAAITESASGRQAWTARTFIDATGNGDLGARAGCQFAMGSETGELQPLTFMAAITVADVKAVADFIVGYPWPPDTPKRPRKPLTDYLLSIGIDPSYHNCVLFQLRGNLVALMVNHEYGVDATNARQMTAATLHARAEVNRIVDVLTKTPGPFQGCQLVTTADHIGIRDGRRILGRYTVSVDDLTRGARHADAVCRVHFNVDVHDTNPAQGKRLSKRGITVEPYDIPLRALIAADVDGLLMAGRCISGQWLAHASYRITGAAVSLGEAAGAVAAFAAKNRLLPHEVPWDKVASAR